MKKVFFIIAIFICSFSLAQKTKKPNIILIYADDLGRGMLSTYGQQIVATPNIDRLAQEGMQFEYAYGNTYCAPARASLLTGMHDCHGTHQLDVVKGGIYKKLDQELSFEQIKNTINKSAIPAQENEVFLGQMAQKAGYVTAEFGKLEWGFSTTPERLDRHGWDEHFGYYDHVRCHGFYPPFLFENGKKINIPGNTHVDCAKTPESDTPENYKKRWNMVGKKVYSENIIMDKLLRFIERQQPSKTQQPFFIYFPTQLPHGPIAVPEVHSDFKNNSKLTELEKEYASMVKMLDDDVGRIYKKLEDLQLIENTIIVFTSDNGHEIYYPKEGRTAKGHKDVQGNPYDHINTRFNSTVAGDIFDGNDGMSGKKRDSWEGGTRVPLFWYWKGTIKAGTISNQIVSNYDFFNTLAEIVGQKQHQEKDGISYAKTLFGKKSNPHKYIIYSSSIGPSLVTKEGWKLRYITKKNIFQLYFLPNDYKETHNLAQQKPELLQKLKHILYKECDYDWKNGFGPQIIKI